MHANNLKSTFVQVMLGAIKQQAIAWADADPDLCCNVMPLGNIELTKVLV